MAIAQLLAPAWFIQFQGEIQKRFDALELEISELKQQLANAEDDQ